MIFPAATGGGYRRINHQWPCQPAQPFAIGDIFHKGDNIKTSRARKQPGSQEQHLITGGDPGEARALIHKPFYYPKYRSIATQAHPAKAPLGSTVQAGFESLSINSGATIRMQEQYILTISYLPSQVHLPGPAGLREQQLVTQGHGHGHGLVATATVYNDEFAARVALAQILQQRSDALLLVEYGNHEAHTLPQHPGWHQPSSAPPQLLPWPAVQP